MSKPWAKIKVFRSFGPLAPSCKGMGPAWSAYLDSDLGRYHIGCINESKRKAVAYARAWSRRLGNIPVEVEE